MALPWIAACTTNVWDWEEILPTFCTAELFDWLENPRRLWLARMSFQLKMSLVCYQTAQTRAHALPYWNMRRPWGRVYMSMQFLRWVYWRAPSRFATTTVPEELMGVIRSLPSPFLVAFSTCYCYEKKIEEVWFIHIRITWTPAFEATQKHEIIVH